jgi:hypothetical protein
MIILSTIVSLLTANFNIAVLEMMLHTKIAFGKIAFSGDSIQVWVEAPFTKIADLKIW